MTNTVMVWMTAPNAEVAEAIAKALVNESLAACVNIVSQVRSIYRWEGKVENEAEVLMVAKTTAKSFDALAARVKALHPYQVPEIIAVPVTQGHAPYLQWLEESVC
ncbi:MAG: divalent-cation tolerance protein CutA [Myxococcaceae bacterium]|nr:divalent-cation tolerance protein CutA [Myxococcaceae bacterium]